MIIQNLSRHEEKYFKTVYVHQKFVKNYIKGENEIVLKADTVLSAQMLSKFYFASNQCQKNILDF